MTTANNNAVAVGRMSGARDTHSVAAQFLLRLATGLAQLNGSTAHKMWLFDVMERRLLKLTGPCLCRRVQPCEGANVFGEPPMPDVDFERNHAHRGTGTCGHRLAGPVALSVCSGPGVTGRIRAVVATRWLLVVEMLAVSGSRCG